MELMVVMVITAWQSVGAGSVHPVTISLVGGLPLKQYAMVVTSRCCPNQTPHQSSVSEQPSTGMTQTLGTNLPVVVCQEASLHAGRADAAVMFNRD